MDGSVLGRSMDDAIRTIDNGDLEEPLREAAIDLWEEIEEKFHVERKPKKR
jgi:hypothetical protein